MTKRHSALPWLALLSAVGLWGVSFINTKVLLAEFPPASIAWFRLFPALAVLGLMSWRRGERVLPERGDWWRFGLASCFGIVLYMVLENNGLRFTSAPSAALLVASIPVFVWLLEHLTPRALGSAARKPAWLELAAILVSLGGVWFVLFDGPVPDFGQSGLLGNLLVLLAMGSWIVYTFMARRLGRRYSGLQQTTIQSSLALLLYLPFLAAEIPLWRLPSALAVANLLFLGIFCSGLAYVAYLHALKELGTVVPSAFLNLVPVVTIVAGLVALGEIPSAWQLMGAVLIIGSLSFLSLQQVRRRPGQAH